MSYSKMKFGSEKSLLMSARVRTAQERIFQCLWVRGCPMDLRCFEDLNWTFDVFRIRQACSVFVSEAGLLCVDV